MDTGKVVDSYEHREEIIERKHSQLADIHAATAIGYLRDIARKYSPGEPISDTPRNRDLYPNLVGEELDGAMVLEVPIQTRPVPPVVIAKATELGIIIRDVDGREYS